MEKFLLKKNEILEHFLGIRVVQFGKTTFNFCSILTNRYLSIVIPSIFFYLKKRPRNNFAVRRDMVIYFISCMGVFFRFVFQKGREIIFCLRLRKRTVNAHFLQKPLWNLPAIAAIMHDAMQHAPGCLYERFS